MHAATDPAPSAPNSAPPEQDIAPPGLRAGSGPRSDHHRLPDPRTLCVLARSTPLRCQPCEAELQAELLLRDLRREGLITPGARAVLLNAEERLLVRGDWSVLARLLGWLWGWFSYACIGSVLSRLGWLCSCPGHMGMLLLCAWSHDSAAVGGVEEKRW